ncbi:MAG: InlB B-repeat-containing protein, partial [Lachnospiraceae bacterium]|nr:InlB B-repeat-containing protein [Lachnospiraceae bacterium]
MKAFTPKALAYGDFARVGYTFDGWDKDPRQSGDAAYSAGEMVDLLTDINDENVTLYAKWKPINYTIRFNPYEENYETSLSHIINPTAMVDQTVQYDTRFRLDSNLYQRPGYKFVGWGVKTNGTDDIHPGANPADKVGNDETLAHEDWGIYNIERLYANNGYEARNLATEEGEVVDLYSMWEPMNVDYRYETYVADIGKVSQDVTISTLNPNDFTRRDSVLVSNEAQTDSIITVQAPSIEGFTAINADVQVQINGDGSTVVKFYYKRNLYTVSVANGTPYINDTGSTREYRGEGLSDGKPRITAWVVGSDPTSRLMTASFEYDSVVRIASTSAAGYDFNSWTGDAASMNAIGANANNDNFAIRMPANNVALVAHPEPRHDTICTVQYWVQNRSDNGYTLFDGADDRPYGKGTLTGYTDSKISIEPLTFNTDAHQEGFVPVTPVRDRSVIIKGDGNTVFNFYYSRKLYSLTVDRDSNVTSVKINGTSYTANQLPKTISVRYEAEVDLSMTPSGASYSDISDSIFREYENGDSWVYEYPDAPNTHDGMRWKQLNTYQLSQEYTYNEGVWKVLSALGSYMDQSTAWSGYRYPVTRNSRLFACGKGNPTGDATPTGMIKTANNYEQLIATRHDHTDIYGDCYKISVPSDYMLLSDPDDTTILPSYVKKYLDAPATDTRISYIGRAASMEIVAYGHNIFSYFDNGSKINYGYDITDGIGTDLTHSSYSSAPLMKVEKDHKAYINFYNSEPTEDLFVRYGEAVKNFLVTIDQNGDRKYYYRIDNLIIEPYSPGRDLSVKKSSIACLQFKEMEGKVRFKTKFTSKNNDDQYKRQFYKILIEKHTPGEVIWSSSSTPTVSYTVSNGLDSIDELITGWSGYIGFSD